MSAVSGRQALDDEVLRALHAEGRYADFVTLLIEQYGPELSSFIGSLLHSESHVAEAFATLCEDLWRGVAGFRYACSARTWAYALARHAALRFRKQSARHARKKLSLSDPGRAPEELAAHVRSSTAHYLRSDFKDRIRRLRAELCEQDRTMLGLRLERGLSWREIARILADPSEPPAEAELEIVAVRLRQRMTTVRSRLKELARREGWLDRE